MNTVWIIFKREVKAYFNNPLAYVLIIIFTLLALGLAFLTGFIENNDASLEGFFRWHPWIYMIFGPAIGMRLWAEEHRTGTTELLLTMPVSPWQAIAGKFLASLVVLSAALLSTVSILFTVSWLGDPDWAKVICGYIGSFLVGAASIAIACAVSALTRSQITCLLVSVFICFILVLLGYDFVADFFRDVSETLSSIANGISLLWHGQEMAKGNMRLQSLVYLFSVIGFSLFATSVIIRTKRS